MASGNAKTSRINLMEHMFKGMISSGEILPSEIMTGFHNALAFGTVWIQTFGHVSEKGLNKAFSHMDGLVDTLKKMEKDFSGE